jgi:hypothetical protein
LLAEDKRFDDERRVVDDLARLVTQVIDEDEAATRRALEVMGRLDGRLSD